MGAHASRLLSDFIAALGLVWLVVAVYFATGLRTVIGARGDLFESVAWGKFFAGAVYAGLSVLFFYLLFRGVI